MTKNELEEQIRIVLEEAGPMENMNLTLSKIMRRIDDFVEILGQNVIQCFNEEE